MILDTNALSALADGDEGLSGKMESVSVPSLPSIVLGEFRYGILGSKFHSRYEGWLQNSLKAFAVVSLDGATAPTFQLHSRDSSRHLVKKWRHTPLSPSERELAREHARSIASLLYSSRGSFGRRPLRWIFLCWIMLSLAVEVPIHSVGVTLASEGLASFD